MQRTCCRQIGLTHAFAMAGDALAAAGAASRRVDRRGTIITLLTHMMLINRPNVWPRMERTHNGNLGFYPRSAFAQ